MLVGRNRSVRGRIVNILLMVAGSLLPVVLWAAGARLGLWAWPRGNSAFGVLTGVVGGLIVYFEMAVWPRKWLRGWRLGAAKVWLRWHVWLGIACLPVIVLHSGFVLGGPLSAITLVLFLLVIASGVWGLVLQQWLPHKLLTDVPGETVASQVDRAADRHLTEAANIVTELTAPPPEDAELIAVTGAATRTVALQAVVTGPPADQLAVFHDEVLTPYLRHGRRSGSPLRSRARADVLFARLRAAVPAYALPGLNRLEELADLRRQWDGQVRLNFWLHSWLAVHLPVSVAMTLFMTVHAVMALKYW